MNNFSVGEEKREEMYLYSVYIKKKIQKFSCNIRKFRECCVVDFTPCLHFSQILLKILHSKHVLTIFFLLYVYNVLYTYDVVRYSLIRISSTKKFLHSLFNTSLKCKSLCNSGTDSDLNSRSG